MKARRLVMFFQWLCLLGFFSTSDCRDVANSLVDYVCIPTVFLYVIVKNMLTFYSIGGNRTLADAYLLSDTQVNTSLHMNVGCFFVCISDSQPILQFVFKD